MQVAKILKRLNYTCRYLPLGKMLLLCHAHFLRCLASVHKWLQWIILWIVTTAVQFSFNRADVAISEGGDLSSQISILKSGENNETISFQVRVISDTARENQGTKIVLMMA